MTSDYFNILSHLLAYFTEAEFVYCAVGVQSLGMRSLVFEGLQVTNEFPSFSKQVQFV